MKKNEAKNKVKKACETAARYASRWLYLLALVAAALYAFWIWEKYVVKSDWSEERKQEYVKEQSVFSFDKKNYEEAVDLLESRKERLDNQEKYSGRDMFFPEGF